MTPEQRATWARQQALGFACMVRDEGREGLEEWLSKHDRHALECIAIALACAVPIDVPASELYGWIDGPPQPVRVQHRTKLQPCGTRAAAERHRVNGEQLCADCRAAVQKYDRMRKRRERDTDATRWRVAG